MMYPRNIPKRRVDAIERALADNGLMLSEIAETSDGLTVRFRSSDVFSPCYRADLASYAGRWYWWAHWLGADGTFTKGRRVATPAAALRDWLRDTQLEA